MLHTFSIPFFIPLADINATIAIHIAVYIVNSTGFAINPSNADLYCSEVNPLSCPVAVFTIYPNNHPIICI